jgi:hypothetical protein
MASMRNLVAALGCAAALLNAAEPSASVSYEVEIDTSSLGSQSVGLAFDLFNNNPQPSSVTITSFSASGGTLGTATLGIDAASPVAVPNLEAANLPMTISDVGFFNEYLQGIDFAVVPSMLSFAFAVTASPDASYGPDVFAFYILDSDGTPLLWTNPDGGGALFQFSIGNSPPETIYSDAVVKFGAVPEPGTLGLAGVALAAFGFRRSARRSWPRR